MINNFLTIKLIKKAFFEFSKKITPYYFKKSTMNRNFDLRSQLSSRSFNRYDDNHQGSNYKKHRKITSRQNDRNNNTPYYRNNVHNTFQKSLKTGPLYFHHIFDRDGLNSSNFPILSDIFTQSKQILLIDGEKCIQRKLFI